MSMIAKVKLLNAAALIEDAAINPFPHRSPELVAMVQRLRHIAWELAQMEVRDDLNS